MRKTISTSLSNPTAKKLRIVFMGSTKSCISNTLFQYLWNIVKKYPNFELVGTVNTFTKPPSIKESMLEFMNYFRNQILNNGFSKESFNRIVKKEKIPFLNPPNYDINHPQVLNYIDKLKPDIILVCGCDQIVKKPLLERYTMVNFHWSLLPKYKGHGATVFPLINKEKETGITFHLMTEKIDSGGILLQKRVDISPNDTVSTLSLKLLKLGGESIEELLLNFLTGKTTFKKQQKKGKAYTYKDMDNAKTIDWNLSSKEIKRRFRILGSMYIKQPKLLVTNLVEVNQNNPNSSEGQVVKVSSNGIVVACKEGCILIKSIYYLPTIISVAILKLLGVRKGKIMEEKDK